MIASWNLPLSGEAEARGVVVSDKESEAKVLLCAVYGHTLGEIHGWISELAEVAADPDGAAKRRGLPATGSVELRLDLKLTEAPDLGRLVQWIGSSAGKAESAEFSEGAWPCDRSVFSSKAKQIPAASHAWEGEDATFKKVLSSKVVREGIRYFAKPGWRQILAQGGL